jgi:GntR family transcriptional regulator
MSQPAYQDIAEAIRADIAAQRLVEGDRLPTVRELAQTYGVPVGTVARAIDLLRADGVVVSRHGKGVFVRKFARINRSSPGRVSKTQWGTGKAIQDHDTNGRLRAEHVVVGEVSAPESVAAAFGIPAGAAVLARSRRYAVEERAVMLATSFIPLDVVAAAPSIAYSEPGPGGMYARMTEAGIGPARFTESLICRMPKPAEASDLGLPGGTPVVSITRYAYTESGRCVEVNEMLLDASAYALEYHFAA